jgi:hypothetical protein
MEKTQHMGVILGGSRIMESFYTAMRNHVSLFCCGAIRLIAATQS